LIEARLTAGRGAGPEQTGKGRKKNNLGNVKKLGDLAFGYAWIVCFESFKFTESILNITQNPPPQVKDLLSKPL